MSTQISIFVGTMTGTAELVAEEMRTALEGEGFAVDVALMDDLTADAFTPDKTYLICSSTYGNGDVPDNAQAFFASLGEERPDLSAIRYGLVSLGDMTYKATFCRGGIQFDELLQSLGAQRLGEMLLHDASSGTLPEDIGAAWSVAWARESLSVPS